MMYGAWDIRHDKQGFLSFWAIFCPLTLLITWKIKVLKKWKKQLKIFFYTCIPQMMVIWCIVPEIWSTTDRIFCHFRLFFALLPTNNPENQNFEKMKKNTWRHYHFTHVYHKLKLYDVWFLRYGVQQTEFFSFWTIFCPFSPLTTQKIKILKKWKKSLEISSFHSSVP